MKYCWTTISVKNMKESRTFYQDIIGLPLIREFEVGSGVLIAFLGDGDTKIELIFNDYNKDVTFTNNISLGFEIESVDEMMEFLRQKGIKIHSGPFQPQTDTKFFFVLDPNGLKIQFVEKH